MRNVEWNAISMIVLIGSYNKAKKSGYDKWAHINVYVCPVKDGKPVKALVQTVEFWPADQSVNELSVICDAKGENISVEGKSYKRYKLSGDAIPDDYRDMFSFMGELRWERIDFGNDMLKIRRSDDGKRIVPVKDENGKHIIASGQTLAYWVGDMITSGLQLSREWRLARMMRDWMPLTSIDEVEESEAEATETTDDASVLGGEA